MKKRRVAQLLMVTLAVAGLCVCGSGEGENFTETQVNAEIQSEESEGEVQETEDQEEQKEVWLPVDTTYTYELFSVPESFDETQPYAVMYIDSSITY